MSNKNYAQTVFSPQCEEYDAGSCVLGHSRADIFERYYISQKVKRDVESAYLGCPARELVIRAVGMMNLTWDPRVQKDLTDEQKSTIDQHPCLIELGRQKQNLVSDMKCQYGSVPKAQTIQSERRFLRKCARDEIRERFFAQIDTIEIEHQLLGLSLPDDLNVEDADDVRFASAERACLARSLFQPLSSSVHKTCELHGRRVQVIRDWTALCGLQGVPYKQKASLGDLVTLKGELKPIDVDIFPMICPATQCLFCLGNEQWACNFSPYSFSRTEKMRRHVYDCHLRYLASDACFPCPHPVCSENVRGIA
ncbi:hypothetical protein PAAG_05012 [Paracoccidioides lutzii Pb01]|uniref:FluG domain-containing protein n=1 Tax=Paracoccidioides lutzii (strain ATCC MYA-826 / Pb01) TaxID=502779 RepID=C1H2L9_PARBA|nr:hypothetical protein PAAG_05012 [Paracoccidioides lutzii Pb01]EEH33963.2 hypothetical protein PAAG_05012 [Paracoccidioides lutzii Pb01]